ncbi:hypothetical protein [Streptomyces sp. NBC_00690]|uniref:hypothetical protein n=1 Tax=Streptomyces sp. NBC_00690 TaxID=2975808 RepID=UPI002E2A8CCD|nr:hypothetical protein [Streptomyces sp. NBC_00690]
MSAHEHDVDEGRLTLLWFVDRRRALDDHLDVAPLRFDEVLRQLDQALGPCLPFGIGHIAPSEVPVPGSEMRHHPPPGVQSEQVLRR